MEHLLPKGQKAPFQIPYFQRADNNGELPSAAPLFEAIVKHYRSMGNSTDIDDVSLRQLWQEQCRICGVDNLCHVLFDRFYFDPLYGLLSPDAVLADFTSRDEDGSVTLTTTALELYLKTWKTRCEKLDAETIERLNGHWYLVLEQAAMVLRSLACFLDLIYANLSSSADYKHLDGDPLGMTHFGCVLLHQTLAQACGRLPLIEHEAVSPLSLSGKVPWLKRKMEVEGWCPFTLRKLFDSCGIDELVYGYALGTVRSVVGVI